MQAELGANSPSVEGVDFRISANLWKKTKVVSGEDRRCFFEEDLAVTCRHYPGTSCHPFYKRGIPDRVLLANTTPPSLCPPQKGNLISRNGISEGRRHFWVARFWAKPNV